MNEKLTVEGIWPPKTSPCPVWRDSTPPSEDPLEVLDLSVDVKRQSPLQQSTPFLIPDTVQTSEYRPEISEKDFAEISMKDLKISTNKICPPSTQTHPESSNLYLELSAAHDPLPGGYEGHEGTTGQLLPENLADPLPSPVIGFTPSLTPHTLNPTQYMPFISENMNSTEVPMERMDISSSAICSSSIQMHPTSSNLYPELSAEHVPFPGSNEGHGRTPGQLISAHFTDTLPSPLDVFTHSPTHHMMSPNQDMPGISEKVDDTKNEMEEVITSSSEILPASIQKHPKSSNLYLELSAAHVPLPGGYEGHEGTTGQLLPENLADPLLSPVIGFTPSLTPHSLNPTQYMPFISENMNSTEVPMERMDISSSAICPSSIQMHPTSSNLYPELSAEHVPFPGSNEGHGGTPEQLLTTSFTYPLPSPLDVFTPSLSPHTLNPKQDMPGIYEKMNSTEISMKELHASSTKIYLPSTQTHQKSTGLYRELSAKNVPFQGGDVNHERRPGHLLSADGMDPVSLLHDLFTPSTTFHLMDPNRDMPVNSEKVNAKKIKMEEVITFGNEIRPHYVPMQLKSTDLHRKLAAEQFWVREGSDGNKETAGQFILEDSMDVHVKLRGEKASADQEEPDKADRNVQTNLENNISEKCEAAERDAKYTQHSKEMVATRGYRKESSEQFLKSIDQYKENTRSMRRRLADLMLENKIARAKLNW